MSRKFFFFPLLVIAFFLLCLRLFWLQIIKKEENRLLSEGNRIRIIRKQALRGVFFDCKGRQLVRNSQKGRQYLYPYEFAHVLGYIAQADEKELIELRKNIDFSNYLTASDSVYLVGKSGLEKKYDRELRGKDGGVIVEVNSLGEIVREIRQYQSQNGENLKLNLDLDLQKKIYQLIKDKKGAAVASNPQTGEVLALVSSPSFDPNLFTLPTEEFLAQVKELFNNSDQPLFNRAVSGLYPPGSIFKIVTAIAGLEEGKINNTTQIEDEGELKIEQFGRIYTYANWYFSQYGQKEGVLDLVKALKRSNDIFFYKTGEKLGIKKLSEWARYFGLGQTLEIDLEEEAMGLIPDDEWKKEKKNEDWYLGDTYITSIGQGDLLLTPLQTNQIVSVVAAQGKFCQPHLYNLENKNYCFNLKIKKENLALVYEGLKEACENGGTAPIFANFKPKVGCKTGTAESGDTQNKTHAWFSVFAPLDNPQIVLTVLLEKAGEGSKEAAPLAKEILSFWFKNNGQAD